MLINSLHIQQFSFWQSNLLFIIHKQASTILPKNSCNSDMCCIINKLDTVTVGDPLGIARTLCEQYSNFVSYITIASQKKFGLKFQIRADLALAPRYSVINYCCCDPPTIYHLRTSASLEHHKFRIPTAKKIQGCLLLRTR